MTDFETRVAQLLRELGAPPDFVHRCKLPLQPEASDIVRSDDDIFGREQWMTPQTARAWQAMKAAALTDNVELQLVSAWRSVDYQCELIRRKLESGQEIENILSVNAAPGYSEHHSGRALDLNTPGCEPLSEAFEQTDAFRWLCEHARRFDFSMSYPRDNVYGIIYEPWHWSHEDRHGRARSNA